MTSYDFLIFCVGFISERCSAKPINEIIIIIIPLSLNFRTIMKVTWKSLVYLQAPVLSAETEIPLRNTSSDFITIFNCPSIRFRT